MGSSRLFKTIQGYSGYSSPFQHGPAYSSLGQPIIVISSLFHLRYSILFQTTPGNFSLLQEIPGYFKLLHVIISYSGLLQAIPYYFRHFQPRPAYSSLCKDIQSYSSLNQHIPAKFRPGFSVYHRVHEVSPLARWESLTQGKDSKRVYSEVYKEYKLGNVLKLDGKGSTLTTEQTPWTP